MSHKSSGLMVV